MVQAPASKPRARCINCSPSPTRSASPPPSSPAKPPRRCSTSSEPRWVIPSASKTQPKTWNHTSLEWLKRLAVRPRPAGPRAAIGWPNTCGHPEIRAPILALIRLTRCSIACRGRQSRQLPSCWRSPLQPSPRPRRCSNRSSATRLPRPKHRPPELPLFRPHRPQQPHPSCQPRQSPRNRQSPSIFPRPTTRSPDSSVATKATRSDLP